MENVTTALKIAAAVVITILIIGIAFTIYNKSKSTTDSAMNQMDNLTTTLNESDFTQYDGATVTGTDVLNVINKYRNDILCVTVDNGRTETEYIYNSTLSAVSTNNIADAKDRSNLNKYINPNASFVGEVIRDEQTGTIIGLKFSIRVR